ncbi:MAG: flagellar filament capping protein FliD [Acidobacteriota bacterium]
MSLSPLTFSGVSKFSQDFGTIMDRAVKIAQIPIQQMQNRDADILQQKSLLGGLSAGAAGLASSLRALGDTATGRALASSSSKPAVISVANSGATVAAAYTIDSVTSIASAASERSVTGYTDSAATAVGSTGDFKLVVGGADYTFHLANNNLVGLRDKINTLGAGVTASILTTADGNYLSVSASSSGETTLALYDDPAGANTNLITGTNQGTDLEFSLNGIPVHQSRNLVNSVIPGLTFTVLEESETAVQLSLSTDRSQLTSALSAFVANLNSLRGSVSAQVGPAAGLLSGNFVVRQLGSQLRNLASLRSSQGEINSLTDLGITFNNSGKAEFDPAKIGALTENGVSDAFTFLGDSSSGLSGFAKTFEQFSEPVAGLIKLEQQGLDRMDKSLQRQVEALNERIAVMQRGLSLKLQHADALLAQLESQQNTINASLQGLNVVLYGKQT